MNSIVESSTRSNSPNFDCVFRRDFESLLKWRRDVRRFRSDPVEAQLIGHLISLACLAPSVGYSQPWRFVLVESRDCREAIKANFERSNHDALRRYTGERAQLYASLKLAGLSEAPVHLAVFVDLGTDHGDRLGRMTMPETLEYSVVIAVHTFWLAARAYELGVGWVSIIDPGDVQRSLNVPDEWKLIAYLCVGYPEQDHFAPELLRRGWEDTLSLGNVIVKR